MACWFVFAGLFLFRKRSKDFGESKRDSRAMLWIALQAVGYAFVWSGRRGIGAPFLDERWQPLVGVLAMLLGVASVWLVMRSLRALGKLWAVAARLVEDHQLVTDGPYNLVRNPIYTGIGGMLIATGLAFSTPKRLLAGLFVFAVATMLRVRVEEQLLSDRFGAEFAAYKARVPSLIPGIRGLSK